MIWQFPPTLWLVCLFLTVSFKEEFLILLMSILSICSFKHDILEIVPKRYFWLMWQIVTCAFFYNFHSLRFTFRSECLSKFCRQWERKTSVAGGKSHCSQLGLSFGQSSVFFWALLPRPWEVSCTDWVSTQLGAPPISSVLPLQHCLLSGFTLQSLAFTSQAQIHLFSQSIYWALFAYSFPSPANTGPESPHLRTTSFFVFWNFILYCTA